MDDEDVFYDELLDRLEDIPKSARAQIQTFGLRTLPSNKAYTSLGVWTCNLLPNVTRLYVDSSLLPPLGEGGEDMEDILARMERQDPVVPRPGNPNELPFSLYTAPSKVEAYAFAGSSLGGIFGHMEGLHGQRKFIKDIFPDIKRIYLFSLAWQVDGRSMNYQAERVALDFDAVTGIELIVNIVIQGAEPASWCAPEASVYSLPNGTMNIGNVVVDQMHGTQE
ncbi:hypothetical protein CBS101457_004930 [Exobasidium rhododendri]|nr:hypothetical protein CBS101457_004930 [Exobasidium rhododendri]